MANLFDTVLRPLSASLKEFGVAKKRLGKLESWTHADVTRWILSTMSRLHDGAPLSSTEVKQFIKMLPRVASWLGGELSQDVEALTSTMDRMSSAEIRPRLLRVVTSCRRLELALIPPDLSVGAAPPEEAGIPTYPDREIDVIVAYVRTALKCGPDAPPSEIYAQMLDDAPGRFNRISLSSIPRYWRTVRAALQSGQVNYDAVPDFKHVFPDDYWKRWKMKT